MRKVILFPLLGLAACATPLQQCINNASQDFRVVSGLIATTQANIQRGYAIRTEEYFETGQQVCGVIEGQEIYCEVPVAQTREVPVAIDLNAEAAKLESLQAKRAELAESSNAAISQCQRTYPEA